jgi:hypothetical protein
VGEESFFTAESAKVAEKRIGRGKILSRPPMQIVD